MDAGACAGGEGDDGEEWGRDDGVGGEEAFVWRCVGGIGGGGGMAHLEGEAVVFVDEQVRPREGDVVVEVCDVLVDMVAVWAEEWLVLIGKSRRRGKAERWHTGEHILFEFLAPFLKLLHWQGGQVSYPPKVQQCGMTYCLS